MQGRSRGTRFNESCGMRHMTNTEQQAWLDLLRLHSTTCLRNLLKEDLSVELHDMVTKELEVREV